jgi:hypothetical protein
MILQAWNLINEPRCETPVNEGCPEVLQVRLGDSLVIIIIITIDIAVFVPAGVAVVIGRSSNAIRALKDD